MEMAWSPSKGAAGTPAQSTYSDFQGFRGGAPTNGYDTYQRSGTQHTPPGNREGQYDVSHPDADTYAAVGEGQYDVSHPDADKYAAVGEGQYNVSHPDADKYAAAVLPAQAAYDVDFGSDSDVDL